MSEQQAVYTVITFEELCRVSPELLDIRRDALRLLANERDRNHWRYYVELKQRMQRYAGMMAINKPEHCQTVQAYDVAHREIFRGLV